MTGPTESPAALRADVDDVAGQRSAPRNTLSRRELEHELFALTCRHMRKLVGHSSDYEDLVQVAAVRALRDVSSFEGRSSLSTWVFRVCYTALLDERRWYRRWAKRFTSSAPADLHEAPDASLEDASASLELRERRAILLAAVERLTPKLRAVVTLHDLQGMSIEEVAELIGVNPLTVRSRLRDGRRDLSRRLAKHPYFGEQARGQA